MRLAARIIAIASVLAATAAGRAQLLEPTAVVDGSEASDWIASEDEEPPLFFAANRPAPDIASPGPDLGDFPNSAFTLPRGGIYVEQGPFTLQTANRQVPVIYTWPFLLRFGLTDDVEFRVFGSGLTSISGPNGTTGFAPLALDLKVHLWNDRMEVLRPAASLEVFVQTTWGSQNLSGGTQPSLNLNLDFPITEATNIEMTLGYMGVQDPVLVVGPRGGSRLINLNVNEFSYQWALEHQVTDRFQIFVHGFYNGPIIFQSGQGIAVGIGYFYQLSDRWMLFNSYNTGLTTATPPFFTQFGLAVAL